MFNIRIDGSAGVGKTRYFNRLTTGEFANFPVRRRVLDMNTNMGPISFVLHDAEGCDNPDAIIRLRRQDEDVINGRNIVNVISKDDRGQLQNSVSALTWHNLEVPLLTIARRLLRNDNIVFIQSAPVAPPVVRP